MTDSQFEILRREIAELRGLIATKNGSMNQSRSDEPTPEKSWNLQTQEIQFDLTDVREIAALYVLQHCQPGESLSGHIKQFWSQIPLDFKTYEFGSMRKHVAKVFKDKNINPPWLER
jgi:hypothetical protein